MKKTTLLLPLLAASLLLSAGTAKAVIIANWDGVPNDVLPSGSLNVTETTTFTTASFQSPAQGASYYPASANDGTETPNFYAALDSLGPAGYNLFDGGSNDLLFRHNQNGATPQTGSSMIAFAGNTGLTLEMLTNTGFGGFGGAGNVNVNIAQYRFIFQSSDSMWWASDTLFTSGDSIADATAATWRSFTPHSAGVATVGAVAAPTNFNAALVGYFQEFTTQNGGTNANGGVFSTGFSATAIPEPGTFGLLGLGALATVLVRRRRN